MSEKPETRDTEMQDEDTKDEEEVIDTSTRSSTKGNEYFKFKIAESKQLSNVHPTNRENPVGEAGGDSAKVPNSKDLLYSFVYCKYGGAGVHLKCYGQNTQLFKCKAKDADIYDIMFIGDKGAHCKETKIKPDSIHGFLCRKTGGLMKRVCIEHSNSKNIEFGHLVCGFYCDDIEIKDLSKMTFYRKMYDDRTYTYEYKGCFGGTTQGFMLQCDRSSCKNIGHPYCLNEDRKEAAATEDESAVTWEIVASDGVSDQSKAIPDRQGLGIIGYKGSEIIEEYRRNKWKRGGFIMVHCDIHRDLVEYCTGATKEDEDQEIFMIGCDYGGK